MTSHNRRHENTPTFVLFPTGLKNIQEWTKRSLRQKPFATAMGKIWTSTPTYMALEQIYTQLSLVQKERNAAATEIRQVPLNDIIQLFSAEVLTDTTDGPPSRILITGSSVDRLSAENCTQVGSCFSILDCIVYKKYFMVFSYRCRRSREVHSTEVSSSGLGKYNIRAAEVF